MLSFNGKLVLPTERVQCSNLSTLHNLHQFTKSTTCFDKYTHITTNRVPMVVTYHPSLPNIGSILRKLQPLLHCSQKYRKAIKDVPFMAFRKPKSLRDYLVHTKLRPSTRLEQSSKGTEVCVNRRCQVCKTPKLGEKFTSYRTGKSYTINYELDCNSGNVVYLSCKVCHAQYVGSTTTKCRFRFNSRKAHFSNKGDLVYRHFSGLGHLGLEDDSKQLIDRVSGEESALWGKEGQWAYRLNCIQPQGLNIRDFFTARKGRLGLESSKSAHVFILLCSVCKFSFLFVIM